MAREQFERCAFNTQECGSLSHCTTENDQFAVLEDPIVYSRLVFYTISVEPHREPVCIDLKQSRGKDSELDISRREHLERTVVSNGRGRIKERYYQRPALESWMGKNHRAEGKPNFSERERVGAS